MHIKTQSVPQMHADEFFCICVKKHMEGQLWDKKTELKWGTILDAYIWL